MFGTSVSLSALAGLFVVFTNPPHTQTHSDFARVMSAVVRVRADGCGRARPEEGTGFAWRSESRGVWIVTARHVVAGCNNITLFLTHISGESHNHPFRTSVAYENATSDLALLRSEEVLQQVTPLSASPQCPPARSTVVAYGFPMGILTARDFPMEVPDGSRRCGAQLTYDARMSLAEARTLDPQLNILPLPFGPVPGMSGGPILDSARTHVVAIVSGGLRDGSAGINWGIPASELERVFSASLTMAPRGGSSSALYANGTTPLCTGGANGVCYPPVTPGPDEANRLGSRTSDERRRRPTTSAHSPTSVVTSLPPSVSIPPPTPTGTGMFGTRTGPPLDPLDDTLP